LSRGYKVQVIDQLWFGNALPSDIELIQSDVMKVSERDLDGVDVVIFIAGLSNDPMAEYSPDKNFIFNASAPAYLAYIAKRAGVRRFIHGGSCSVYGYTLNELYDETMPANSNHAYGISKLQGEFGCMQLVDDKFSVIALRKGTVSGFSPRMRFDLVINTMFKCAVQDGVIYVNNPSIWRPILAMRDAVDVYVRATEGSPEISGIFNVASANHTVGEMADYVAEGVKEALNIDTKIIVKHITDFRNYKVTCEKVRNVLGFHPRFAVRDIVKELADNVEKFGNFESDQYYNIKTFENLNPR
jgi:nucleoside-diphosphate-sugar epimerase